MNRRMMRAIVAIAAMSVAVAASAQEHLQKQASNKTVAKVFTTVKELPITSVKKHLVYVTRLHGAGHHLPVPQPSCTL